MKRVTVVMKLLNWYFWVQFCIICLYFQLPHGTAIQGDNVRDARENEFPFTVALAEIGNRVSIVYLSPGYFQFCTGSLITRKHVLTAEHCVLNKNVKNVVILVGSVDLYQCKAYIPESWITYQEWKYNSSNEFPPGIHDVAIITLEISADQLQVQPAVVPTFKPEDIFGSEVKIAGWGFTNDLVEPAVLRIVHLKVLPRAKCNFAITLLEKRTVMLPDWILCTISNPWALNDCGDSGGPLLNNRNELIAITTGICPDEATIFEKFPQNIIHKHRLLDRRVNIHSSLHHYEDFVKYFTG